MSLTCWRVYDTCRALVSEVAGRDAALGSVASIIGQTIGPRPVVTRVTPVVGVYGCGHGKHEQ